MLFQLELVVIGHFNNETTGPYPVESAFVCPGYTC